MVLTFERQLNGCLGLAIQPDIRVAAVAMPAFAESDDALIQSSMERETTPEEPRHLQVLELVGPGVE